MMTQVERDILSTPAILGQTLQRLDQDAAAIAPLLDGPVAFIGCGTSYCLSVAAAALYEETRGHPAQGIVASDYHPRPGWVHVAISRSGTTTEIVEAMQRARGAGARVILIGGDRGAPAEEAADAVLHLEFAAEPGVIQTRFIAAAFLALRSLIGGAPAHAALRAIPDRIEQTLSSFDPGDVAQHPHVVYLGRGWRYGLALAAAVNMQETALLVAEAHQTLDYRHGPISCADERALVWCLDPRDDAASAAVLADVSQTGAQARQLDDDPLVAISQTQLLAVRMAAQRHVNPDTPRHLTRSVVLPATGA